MHDDILTTDHLEKRFKRTVAVHGINLAVPAGSIYGLLGPNGAGKTTTLKLVTGLLHPSAGKITVFGRPWERACLERIGALIESPALYGNLTATENLKIHCRLMGCPQEQVFEVLETVGLKDTGKKPASQFSLGMKQRLGLAIALLGNPQLLILDEPTNGLDPVGIQELRQLIRSFPQRGMTVILSSHLLTEVSQLVDHIGIISAGELKYQGKLERTGDLEELFIRVVRGENND